MKRTMREPMVGVENPAAQIARRLTSNSPPAKLEECSMQLEYPVSVPPMGRPPSSNTCPATTTTEIQQNAAIACWTTSKEMRNQPAGHLEPASQTLTRRVFSPRQQVKILRQPTVDAETPVPPRHERLYTARMLGRHRPSQPTRTEAALHSARKRVDALAVAHSESAPVHGLLGRLQRSRSRCSRS